jgi:hypothetical protein
MGGQNRHVANLSESSRLIHRKMARAKTVLAIHHKTFMVQGCSPSTQELAAVEEIGKTTSMMFALLHKQHNAWLKSMAAANKQAMDAMLECMNALIASQGKAADKITATIANKNTSHSSSTTNHKKKKCANCRKLVFHKPETCYEP